MSEDKLNLKIAPDDFVDYMHKTYPDPDGLPFRTAMLQAFDYLSGNFHEHEKSRKKIAEKIEKKIRENQINMKTKTYILKHNVYNNIEFPIGTIIKPIQEQFAKFEVVEGKLTGEKGDIADGLDGWLLEDTAENRKIFSDFTAEAKKIKKSLEDLKERWEALPTATI